MECGIVPGEGEQDDGEGAEHDDVNGTVDGNEPKHVLVAQDRAPHGSSISSCSGIRSRWCSGRVGGNPGVAPQAPVPPDPITVPANMLNPPG